MKMTSFVSFNRLKLFVQNVNEYFVEHRVAIEIERKHNTHQMNIYIIERGREKKRVYFPIGDKQYFDRPIVNH